MTPRELILGGVRVRCLEDGRFTIPRGAMYVRPPAEAETRNQGPPPASGPDRFVLAMNIFLVESPDARIVIDTGIGTKASSAASELGDLSRGPGLEALLGGFGIGPGDIDIVINTHLHFDHCGGDTASAPDGRLRPAFPNAVYVIQKGEWETALHPPARDEASYVAADFEPLAASGRLRLVEGEAVIAAGVEVVLTPGHTAHHQSVIVRSGGAAMLFAGDLIPTAAHAGFSFVMSYDLDPRLSLKTKRAIYGRSVQEGWIVALAHETDRPFGTIDRDGVGFAFRPLA